MSAFQGSYIVCCRDRILGPIGHELPYLTLSGLIYCLLVDTASHTIVNSTRYMPPVGPRSRHRYAQLFLGIASRPFKALGLIVFCIKRRRIADLAIKHRPVILVRAAAVSLRAVDRLLKSRKADRPAVKVRHTHLLARNVRIPNVASLLK